MTAVATATACASLTLAGQMASTRYARTLLLTWAAGKNTGIVVLIKSSGIALASLRSGTASRLVILRGGDHPNLRWRRQAQTSRSHQFVHAYSRDLLRRVLSCAAAVVPRLGTGRGPGSRDRGAGGCSVSLTVTRCAVRGRGAGRGSRVSGPAPGSGVCARDRRATPGACRPACVQCEIFLRADARHATLTLFRTRARREVHARSRASRRPSSGPLRRAARARSAHGTETLSSRSPPGILAPAPMPAPHSERSTPAPPTAPLACVPRSPLSHHHSRQAAARRRPHERRCRPPLTHPAAR